MGAYYQQTVFSAAAVTTTTASDAALRAYPTKVVEIVTTGFSGTLDIKGTESGTAANVRYRKIQEASIGAASVSQLTYTTETAVTRYIITEPYISLSFVMTRSAGSITLTCTGWPFLVTAEPLTAGTAKIGYTGAPLTIDVATGAAAIAKSSAAHADAFNLVAVTCHFSTAPTTSQSLTVTLNAADGAAYDTVLFSTNPSTTAATDIAYLPDDPIPCKAGDVIDVAFTNTDTRTYGLRIITEGR